MKKFLIIFLMLVYGLPSTGASLYLHFCCGKLDDVSFSKKHKDGCTEKGDDTKKCCNNVAIDLKLDTDQQPLLKTLLLVNETAVTVTPFPEWLASLSASAALVSNKATGPPLLSSSVPVYKKNCVFRI